MRTVVVYESMYGNTRHIAEEIARGIGTAETDPDVTTTVVVPAHAVTPEQLATADLVVMGAPTHVHGLPRPGTRTGAVEQAHDLVLEPDATEAGVRELTTALPDGDGRAAAAFDTRVNILPVLSGRASKAIGRALHHQGYRLLADPESFLVDPETHLLDGELERARAWGATLARSFTETAARLKAAP
jgi:hypothetical protein